MTKSSMNTAVREAKRFIAAAAKVKVTDVTDSYSRLEGPRETGAVRRASMDLTRALAEMRGAGK